MFKPHMDLVIVGHVDHGKSTIIGRLLADTQTLPKGKLELIRENCRRNSKPFEYAFLLDALKDEQAQGITIDAARVFFETPKRRYIIIDAPGHIEFLKNMVSGASRAEVALLVIDAQEGIQENSRRHAYLLSMLGIKQCAVLINKMDLVDYNETIYQNLLTEYQIFLTSLQLEPICYIPVSGMAGDNIATLSNNMPWYRGSHLLHHLDTFKKTPALHHLPFRMPVQDVYKFTSQGDDRRIVAGTVESGEIKVGDDVIFLPSGKKSQIRTIEAFNRPPQEKIQTGEATGVTLTQQIYIPRGEWMICAGDKKPAISTRFQANIFWLGQQPLEPKKDYILKLGTARLLTRLETLIQVLDAASLSVFSEKSQVERHEVATGIFKLQHSLPIETIETHPKLCRFVLVDNYEISGGGIICEVLEDRQSWVREKVLQRNYKWEMSQVPPYKRAEKYNQKSALLLITGERKVGKKTIAKAIEARLFNEGKIVYYLGIGNLLYGVDADIKGTNERREEHIRRLAEVTHIMLDAGLILVVTAVALTQDDLEIIKTTVDAEAIETIWVGEHVTTDISYDLHVTLDEEPVERIKSRLQERGVIFCPW